MFSSVRYPEHIRNAIAAGAHTITVPLKVIKALTENHLIEFEKLLKCCQKLKVLLLNLKSDEVDSSELLRILNNL